MRVHILGSGGSHAGYGRRQTLSTLFPEYNLVFDAGSGLEALAHFFEKERPTSFRSWVNPLLRDNVPLRIFLSHYHLDHTTGLPALPDILYGRDIPGARITGPGKTRKHIRDLFTDPRFRAPLTAINETISVYALPFSQHGTPGRSGSCRAVVSAPVERNGEYGWDSLRVSWHSFPHGEGTAIGYRIESSDGRSVAIVTDTTVPEEDSSAVHSFLSDLDLLIHECQFMNEHKDLARSSGHSWASRVGCRAAAVEPRSLVLVHPSPAYGRYQLAHLRHQVSEHFPLDRIETAFDGLGIHVGETISYFNERPD